MIVFLMNTSKIAVNNDRVSKDAYSTFEFRSSMIVFFLYRNDVMHLAVG